MALASETYDPFAQLLAEHKVVRSTTQAFLEQVQRYEGLIGTVPLDAGPVQRFAEFLAEDLDRKHGAKEEAGLYPVLGRYLPREHRVLEHLREEHDALRAHQAVLAQSAGGLATDPENADLQRAVLRVAGDVHHLLEHHLEKEESNIFPLARGVLTQRDLAEVREAFVRFEQEHGVVASPDEGATASRGPALPPFCAAGRARRDRAERV